MSLADLRTGTECLSTPIFSSTTLVGDPWNVKPCWSAVPVATYSVTPPHRSWQKCCTAAWWPKPLRQGSSPPSCGEEAWGNAGDGQTTHTVSRRREENSPHAPHHSPSHTRHCAGKRRGAEGEGLLTNDSFVVACMRAQGLTQLATANGDFDRIGGMRSTNRRILRNKTPLRISPCNARLPVKSRRPTRRWRRRASAQALSQRGRPWVWPAPQLGRSASRN